jgi:hypothetical protein
MVARPGDGGKAGEHPDLDSITLAEQSVSRVDRGAAIIRGRSIMFHNRLLRLRHAVFVALLAACALACALPRGIAAEKPSATVTIEQVQVSLLVSAGWGSGTLRYEGKSYPFRVHGLGVGGLGVQTLKASGAVYDLNKLDDFAGVYGQLRAGAVAGSADVKGGMWIQNPAGVRMNLVPQRKGLALSLGADGLLVEFNR